MNLKKQNKTARTTRKENQGAAFSEDTQEELWLPWLLQHPPVEVRWRCKRAEENGVWQNFLGENGVWQNFLGDLEG